MYSPDHRASTRGEIKPVSHTNPSALITFTEVMACILSPWQPLMLPVCCLCVWLIFKGKVTGPVAKLSAARANCSPSWAWVLGLHPRDKRKGKRCRKEPTCLSEAGLFRRARFAGRRALGWRCWESRFERTKKHPNFVRIQTSFQRHVSPGVEWSPSSSDTFSDSWAHRRVARWSWGSPLCLSALGGFDFAHLVAVWIVLITILFMKDPCFF